MLVYKLTDKDMRTHGGFQWAIGEWKETSGEGDLCGSGWLHWYLTPELAVLLNPIHGRFDTSTMRLFEAEAGGEIKEDGKVKGGSTRLRLVREIDVPRVSIEQCVRFGILCSREVFYGVGWNKWADRWIDGTDKSAVSAESAWGAVREGWKSMTDSVGAISAAAGAAHAAVFAAADVRLCRTVLVVSEKAVQLAAAEWAADAVVSASRAAFVSGFTLDLVEIAKRAMEG